MFDRILVPLDGSPESEKIRSWVVGLASELESVVDLLAVIDPSKLKQSDASQDRETVAEEESEFARNYLRTQADWLQERNVTVASHVTTGDPAETIVDQARELDSKLIAMVTHRRSAVMRGILGSVSDRVLHSTGVPIMLARPGEVAGFEDGEGLPRKVIVPLDGSNFAEGAIPVAEAIASHTSGEVIYLSGTAPNTSYSAYALADPVVEIEGESRPGGKTGGYLQRVADRSIRRGITASFVNIRETAAEAIIHEVSKSSDRMVVMTSHGASGIKRWLLGSVADKVIRTSEHPVLVIPPEHQQVSYRGSRSRMP